ncbi:hypothetical protein ABEW06_13690 [Peribacillus simplex]
MNAKLEYLYFSQEQGIEFPLKQDDLGAILFPSYCGICWFQAFNEETLTKGKLYEKRRLS